MTTPHLPTAAGGTRAAREDGLILLGVRHHGPGSARAVRAALDAYQPQVVLIEGPPEADALAALAADPAMRPPVALLAHVVDDPARAGFWPFAEFSSEWVAMRWAAKAGAEIRFIDLPAAHTLAMRAAEEAESQGPALPDGLTVPGGLTVVPAEASGPDTAPGAAPDTAPGAAPGNGPGAGPGTGAWGTPDGAPGPGTGAWGTPDGAPGPGTAAGAAPGNGPGAGPGTGAWGTPDGAPGPGTAAGAAPGAEPGGAAVAGPVPGTGPGLDAGRGPEVTPGPVPDAGRGPDAASEPGAGTGPLPAPGAGPDPDLIDAAALRIDPIAVLAQTAGCDDPERWWEDAVEHRGGAEGGDALAPFEALAEAMGVIRETYGDGGYEQDLLREAHMRLRVREARRAYERTAVVCGAWHVPALAVRTTAAADRQSLKGLPKAKVETTWVPWTHRRLARASGYGAGIASPGWYRHLFTAPDRPVTRWMTKVAGLLRDEDLPVSSAHVIEAVRLADTLAAMRGRPLAGLGETTDAIRAVMCDGSDVPLALIQDRLVVGDVLGEVPPDAPAVPLARDLAREQRRLRLRPEALERELELDLRKETDAARSQLLHRLRLLGIAWGEPAASRGGKGTFRETWRLRWEPEAAIRVAEAGIWGTTVHSAATARAEDAAAHATTLAEVTSLAERCLPAGLADALPTVMRALADRAALDTDVAHLAAALPALVRAVRYGDVRGTDSGALTRVAEGLALRICVGFPPACVGLDADSAAALRAHMEEVHRAIGLLPERREPPPAAARGSQAVGGPGVVAPGSPVVGGPGAAAHGSRSVGGPGADPPGVPVLDGPGVAAHGSPSVGGPGADPPGAAPGPVRAARPASADSLRDRWAAVLRSLAERDGAIPGLLRGAAARLLMDDGRLSAEEAARLMGLALSPGTGPGEAAAWVEGFLAGGGMLLVHDERLLGLVDGWLARVSGEAFTDVLPLLRRTFAEFEPGVRRTVGELVRRGPARERGTAAAGAAEAGLPGFGAGLDRARADAATHTVRLLLGTTTATGLAATDSTTAGLATAGLATTDSATTDPAATGLAVTDPAAADAAVRTAATAMRTADPAASGPTTTTDMGEQEDD